MSSELFNKFCQAVDNTIFSEENKGDTVAFVIDQSFIDEFCKQNSISEEQLLREVRCNMYNASFGYRHHISHLHIKGILAIQLYAATKREDSDGITEANYRDRLSQVLLNWELSELQSWMKDNQDYYWQELYRWCDSNNFIISKCRQTTGKGRYVQYPIQQARRVFTQKDLKGIAYYFVQNKLQPGEDIQETDFWRILNKRRLPNYVHNNHGRRLIATPEYLEDAYKQIFNYYLRWDGTYLDYTKNRNARVNDEKYFLFLSDEGYLDIRDKSLKRCERIDWDKLTLKCLNNYYSFKRNQVIVFKKNEDYDGYWEETRYIEGEEDGLAIVFTERSSSNSQYSYNFNSSYGDDSIFSFLQPIFVCSRLKVYRFNYSRNLYSIYSEKRFFSLDGGLKIGRMSYLEGGAPLLKIEKESPFWIDGETPPTKIEDGVLLLNYLKPGKHAIKFPGFKKIEFSILKAEELLHHWDNNYTQWKMNKKENIWSPCADYDSGIVGIDFSSIKMIKQTASSKGVLTRWVLFNAGFDTFKKEEEDNIALRIISR